MTTQEEINAWIEKLSNNGGNRDRVKAFCAKYPNWDPIRGRFQSVPISSQQEKRIK